ncbi:alpha/beta fold hydrolase [Dysosmobacter sp.]|uniref:alpha/beta fold hydrolase n=1 Tax=Dysosmobacter sp. TaxID=2591382 RepID=UPI002A8D9318|nr:alpha/beta hydrolase [Dysosmobacter sp.]MDY3281302.1 alpha/beta hydrolase [Dysosmobacter sp.]
MTSGTARVSTAELAFEIHGCGPVDLVIEMGLCASMAEWRPMAEKLAERYTVLVYQRAGYGESGPSSLERTPEHIASELRELLEETGHAGRITLLGHSQGGLYAWQFARKYPELVDRLVLLDPLSPEDYRFRLELTEEEFRRSGADKTAGLRLSEKLTRLHLGWLVRRTMAGAPPVCCYGFSGREKREILDLLSRRRTYETALAEYAAAHEAENLTGLLDKERFPAIPVVLVTHSSEIAQREIRDYGGASEAQARKIEALWQRLMESYLVCAAHGTPVRAEHSSHYIHLTDEALVWELLGL